MPIEAPSSPPTVIQTEHGNKPIGSTMAAAFDGLDKIAREVPSDLEQPKNPVDRAKVARAPEKPAPKPQANGKPKAAAPAQEEGRPGLDPDEDDEVAVAETETEQEKPEGETEEQPTTEQEGQPEKVTGIKSLRNELAKLKGEIKKRDSEILTLKTTPREDPEKKTLSEKLEAAQKRLEATEETLRFTKYEQHEEYKTKWEKPYVDAYHLGRAKVSRLQVKEVQDPNTGAIVQQKRAATPEDFDAIVAIHNDEEAAEAAERLFGRSATVVIHHRERVLEANQARVNALEENRKTGAEREKQTVAQTQAQAQARNKSFIEGIKAKEEKYEFLKPKDGDQAWNDAIDRGDKLVKQVFMDRANQKPEDLIKADAAVYARAKAFSPLKLENKRLKAEMADLRKKLKDFEVSEPGAANGAPQKGEAPPASAMEGAWRDLEKRTKAR